MATVNRLKKKKEQQSQSKSQQHSQSLYSSKGEINSPLKTMIQKKPKVNNSRNHSEEKQKIYEGYYQISQSNPYGITMTSTLFPHSQQMNAKYGLPLGFCFSPLLVTQNEHIQVMNKSADKIPKCSSCQAYMNCYNSINNKSYTCFLCDHQNPINKDYQLEQTPNEQLNSSIYQLIGPTNFYAKQPSQQTYIFLIDISSQSANAKMLYYLVSSMKQVLSRNQFDDLIIHFFTFDQFVHSYDFSGQEAKCTIIDPSIQGNVIKHQGYTLVQIRQKLFNLLENLEDISINNKRSGYSLATAFSYVYSALGHTGGRFFITQCSEAYASETMFAQAIPKLKQGESNTPKRVSLFETQNKQFFQKYTQSMLNFECSISFFSLSRNYKNFLTIHDSLKLTNSQFKYYSKQSPSDLDKFYYDLSYLLGCSYYKNVRVSFIISSGWSFVGVYGNFYRLKNTLTFQINSIQPSRKIMVLVTNSSKNGDNSYCCLQIITHFRYKRDSFMSVATVVQPVTGYTARLYASIDTQAAIASISRQFFSALRMDSINNARKKLLDACSKVYINALQIYKKNDQMPEQLLTILVSALAMLKSLHSQPQVIMNTPAFDRVISERNFMQFLSATQIATYFNPYLFDLTNLDETMCRDDIQFVYPPSIQVKFQNIRQGLYLLDSGLYLFLFIAKHCDPHLLTEIFGKSELKRVDVLTQETIMQQNNFRASQVLNLIKILREQKSYGWIPLYVVRCGQNTLIQRTFYLNFYCQKYEEFKVYNINFQQFLNVISRPSSY